MGDSEVTSKKVRTQKRRTAKKASKKVASKKVRTKKQGSARKNPKKTTSKKAGIEKRKPATKAGKKRRKIRKDEKGTRRVIDWKALAAKDAARISREVRAYRKNPASTREIHDTILEHLTFMEKEPRERAELEQDPEIRAELIMLADQPADSDMRLPEIGDTRTGIEIAVHKKIPGLPQSALWKSLDYLKKTNRVFIDDEESAKTRDAVYRIASPSVSEPVAETSTDPTNALDEAQWIQKESVDQNGEQSATGNPPQDIPSLNKTSGRWLPSKKAAEHDSLETRTLGVYRRKPHALWIAPDLFSGIDRDGRMWRRRGKKTAHPWYLVSSLTDKP